MAGSRASTRRDDRTLRRAGAVRHRLPRLVSGFVVAVVIIALFVYAGLRASLPLTRGSVVVTSLTAPAVIERDRWGIARISANTYEDAARATGFVHAQERYFQMDLTRRFVAGELAALLGPAALDSDLWTRKLEFRRHARTLRTNLAPRHQRLLSAYVDGVNAGLSGLRARPPEYWLLGFRPKPWTVEDSLLVQYFFFLALSFNRSYEQQVGAMNSALPAQLVEFLTPDTTRFDAPIVDARGDESQSGDSSGYLPLPIPGPDVIDLRHIDPPPLDDSRDLVSSFGDAPIGSNAWLVAGSRTTSGQAILASDPHLPLRVPGTWYQLELNWKQQSAKRMACGASVPGLPGVVLGTNGIIAWAATNVYADQEDYITLETRRDGAQTMYRVGNGWQTIDESNETIEIRGDASQELTIQRTRWGPVFGVAADGTMLALRSAAFADNQVNLDLLDLVHADSMDEAVDIARQWNGPAQNMMLADDQGSIAWVLAGLLPRRRGFDGKTPTSWADGSRGWDGWIAPKDRHVVMNPAGGVLWSANGRTIGPPQSRAVTTAWSASHRAQRIASLFASEPPVDEAANLAMQLDTASPLHAWTADLISEIVSEDDSESELRAALALVKRWNGTADADQRAFTLLRAYHEALREAIIGPLVAAAAVRDSQFVYNWPNVDEPMMRIIDERPMHLLPAGCESWRQRLRDVLSHTISALGGCASIPAWGDVNRASIEHPVLLQIPVGWLADQGNMPTDPLPGHATTIRMHTPSHGPSMRMVVSPARLDEAIMHMPCGQCGHFLSPHFRDQHAHWVDGRSLPMRPGAAVDTLTLRPR